MLLAVRCFRFVFALTAVLGSVSFVTAQDPLSGELRWFKGNLHTHSLWSDGDEFPEMIADWYVQHGYNFLALSDHNTLSDGQRWMAVAAAVKRSDDGLLDRYRKRFGDSWVQTRGTEGEKDHQVRLKPLDEFRGLVEKRGEFIMIPAEEISDKHDGKPIHINATNLAEKIEPQRGDSIRDTIRNNLRAIIEHERSHGRQVLPHLNHPNFGYAVTAEDLAAVETERFFEVYNGHPSVNQLGDKEHPSIEKMWDMINAIRRGDANIKPIMGIATDDSHEYHGKKGSRPGRGWVMVRSRYLTPEHLIQSMKRGDFYASSGVTLKDVQFDNDAAKLSLEIEPSGDATFTTQFLGTKRIKDGAEVVPGEVFATVKGLNPEYTMTGDEMYVRAIVTSSQPHNDPSYENQYQQAWTQPVGWK